MRLRIEITLPLIRKVGKVILLIVVKAVDRVAAYSVNCTICFFSRNWKSCIERSRDQREKLNGINFIIERLKLRGEIDFYVEESYV